MMAIVIFLFGVFALGVAYLFGKSAQLGTHDHDVKPNHDVHPRNDAHD